MADSTPAPSTPGSPAAPGPAPAAGDAPPAATTAPTGTTSPAPETKAGQGDTKTSTGKDGKAPPPAPSFADSAPQLIFMVVGFVALMYFMIIRPQRKREKSRQEMLGKLKVGDRVLTASGMIGEIAEMTNDEVTLKVDARKDVRLRMRRWAIAGPADEATSEQTVKEQAGR